MTNLYLCPSLLWVLNPWLRKVSTFSNFSISPWLFPLTLPRYTHHPLSGYLRLYLITFYGQTSSECSFSFLISVTHMCKVSLKNDISLCFFPLSAPSSFFKFFINLGSFSNLFYYLSPFNNVCFSIIWITYFMRTFDHYMVFFSYTFNTNLLSILNFLSWYNFFIYLINDSFYI